MNTTKHRSRKWACLCWILVLLAGSAAARTTREVNQNDPSAPYQTIGAAVTDALPGDTILVHPGTYQEWVTISGITLKSFKGPEVTVIQSADGTGNGVTLTGNQNVTVSGFRVQGFVNGINVNASGGSAKVGNCIATGNSGVGIQVEASVLLSAKIMSNIAADNGSHGIFTVQDDVIYTSMFNNICYRNGGYGFYDGYYSPFVPTTYGDYNCAFANTLGPQDGYDSLGAHSITVDPLVDATKNYRFTSQSSPAVNTGNPSSFYNDPDGSRCDMGAYGGPDAANWWRDPFTGPTVVNVTVDPPQVRPGSNIVIRATARTE
jgi:hypothetical protein